MQLLQISEATAAQRRILVYLVDDTDGKTPETSVTISAGDVKISKNGAAEANHGGTLTELATGTYYYEFSQSELDTAGFVQFKLIKSGVRTFVKEVQVVPFDPYDAVRMGLTALPNAAADAAGGLPISDAGGLDLDAQLVTKINDILTDTGTTLDGKLDTIDNFLDTEIAAIITTLGTPAGASISADLVVIDNFVDGLESTLTLAAIADAVWDEAIAGHLVAGSTGNALNSAGSAGDPWSTGLPGAYGAGTAGKIIGDNINATISSRASQASLDTVDGIVDTILVDTNELQVDWVNGGRLDLLLDATLSDTNELQTDWANGGRLDLILDARSSQASVDDLPTNAELTTALAAADDAVLAAIAALNNLSAAQVNAEVVDALATDTYAEPGQGAPTATTTLAAKIGYLYKSWRNKKTQTATERKLYADDGTTVDQKATDSDDATTYTKGEVATGP